MRMESLIRRNIGPGHWRSIFHWKACTARLAIGCLLLSATFASQGIAKPPKPFKSFTLKTLEGKKKMLADYAQKLTLIAFFYPQCIYCRASVPHVQRLYDKYKDQGLSVVLINIVEQEDKLIPRYLEEHGITVPVLTGGWQPALMRDYDLEATPTHVLLDTNRTVLLRQDGYAPGDEKVLEAKIVTALNITP